MPTNSGRVTTLGIHSCAQPRTTNLLKEVSSYKTLCTSDALSFTARSLLTYLLLLLCLSINPPVFWFCLLSISLFLSIILSPSLSLYQSHFLRISHSINLSFSLCLCVCLYQSTDFPSISPCLSINRSLTLSLYQSLSFCLHLSPKSLFLSHLSVSISRALCISLYLSLSISLSLSSSLC